MIVNNDTATTAKNTPVTIDVLANDSDLDGGMPVVGQRFHTVPWNCRH